MTDLCKAHCSGISEFNSICIHFENIAQVISLISKHYNIVPILIIFEKASNVRVVIWKMRHVAEEDTSEWRS